MSGTRHSGKYSHCLPVYLRYEALRKILPLPSSISQVRGSQENTPTAFQHVWFKAFRKILPLPSSMSQVQGTQENTPAASMPQVRGTEENTPTAFQYLSGTRQSGKYSHCLPVCLWFEALRKILPLPSSMSQVQGTRENTPTSFQYVWYEAVRKILSLPSSISLVRGSQKNTTTAFQYLSGTRQRGKYLHFLPVFLYHKVVRRIFIPLSFQHFSIRQSAEYPIFPPQSIEF